MPLFEIDFPENTVMFYGFLVSISSFDILPTDQINSVALDINDEESDDSQ